ncbi:MAG: hypothetical protein JXR95_14915 [Deltaproteobacteria bacterium]|nr:hypothetical protein [Deltaproteobacteria bacterium]
MKQTNHSNKNVKKYLIIWIGAVAAIIVLVLMIYGSSKKDKNNKKIDVNTNHESMTSFDRQHHGIKSSPQMVKLPDGADNGLAGVVTDDNVYGNSKSVKRLLNLYKKSRRYGLSTFKLTSDMVDILKPNRFHAVTAPFTTRADSADGQFSDDPEERIYFRFETDRFSFMEDEKIEIRLAVYRGEKSKKPLKAVLSDVSVSKNNEQGVFELLTTTNMGEYSPRFPGDSQYVGNFIPSKFIPDFFDGYLKFSVKWQIEGENPSVSEILVHYTRFPPAEFTGNMRDEIVDGSLKLTAGLNVRKAGKYILTALLYDSDGKNPIAYSNIAVQLGEGETQAEFIFYGIVFRDLAIAGPYKITKLSGYLSGVSAFGKGPLLKDWTGSFQTQPYKLDEFTNLPFTDPVTQSTINAYEKQIKELELKESQSN